MLRQSTAQSNEHAVHLHIFSFFCFFVFLSCYTEMPSARQSATLPTLFRRCSEPSSSKTAIAVSSGGNRTDVILSQQAIAASICVGVGVCLCVREEKRKRKKKKKIVFVFVFFGCWRVDIASV